MKRLRIFETAELAAAILPTLEYSTLSKIRGERGVLLKPVSITSQPNDEIWYTSSDGNIVTPVYEECFGDNITVVSNTYSGNKGIIKLSGNATTFGDNAFWRRTNLTSITIPNGVTTIGMETFYECTGLTSITIPSSVNSIDSSAFNGCISLISIMVDSNNQYYDSRNDCNAIIETSTNTLIKGCNNTVIPNTVIVIGQSAFQGCTGLTSVTIPNSVTSIGEYAFYGCTGLTTITMGNGVTSIGNQAFYNCVGLIGSLIIPDSVTTIGSNAFRSINNVIYSGSSTGSPWGAKAVNGYVDGDFVYTDNTKTTLTGYIGNNSSITIPNSVTTIDQQAFYNCSKLTSITIPNTVTTIGKHVFRNCINLTSVTIPNSVTSIGGSAFYNCSNLTSITIPSSVTSIGNNAFKDVLNVNYNGSATGSPWGARCINGYFEGDFLYVDSTKTTLVRYIGSGGSITIPNSVTSIGTDAFYNCSNLTSITIPNSVTSLGERAFCKCTGLTSVTIPNSISVIDSQVFGYCTGLTSVIIPNSITTIDNGAFIGCERLTSVTIPNSVIYLQGSTFSGCIGLTSITCLPTTPTTLGFGDFDNTSNCPIYVPSSSVYEYMTATGWSTYADRIQAIQDAA